MEMVKENCVIVIDINCIWPNKDINKQVFVFNDIIMRLLKYFAYVSNIAKKKKNLQIN